jgi:hypothetical protein
MSMICALFGHTEQLKRENKPEFFLRFNKGNYVYARKIMTRKVWRCKRCHKSVIKEKWIERF